MDIKGFLAATADHSRFLDAYGFFRRKITKSQIAILMYHRVSQRQDSWSLDSISPDGFERQMIHFCRNYDILSLNRLVEHIKQGDDLPEKALVITFDDGYKDNYRFVFPVLKKYDVPATIFLSTGNIGTGKLFWWDKVSYIIQHTNLDQLYLEELGKFSIRSERERSHANLIANDRLKMFPGEMRDHLIDDLLTISDVEIPDDLGEELILSWDEIREMSNYGIAFGAHTVNHPTLTNLPLEQAAWEIIQSKNDIERMIGHQVTEFSYPHGDINADIAKLVEASGFACAVTILPNRLISQGDSAYGLSRIWVVEDFSKSKVMLCGLWADLKSVLNR